MGRAEPPPTRGKTGRAGGSGAGAVCTTPQRTYVQSLMVDTVGKLQKAGKTTIRPLEMAYDPQASSICGGHPTPASHQSMGAQAAAQIKQDLGW